MTDVTTLPDFNPSGSDVVNEIKQRAAMWAVKANFME